MVFRGKAHCRSRSRPVRAGRERSRRTDFRIPGCVALLDGLLRLRRTDAAIPPAANFFGLYMDGNLSLALGGWRVKKFPTRKY